MVRRPPDFTLTDTCFPTRRSSDLHDGFLLYQSIQSVQNGPKLTGRYWASFVVTPAASTLFVGLYEIEKIGPCDPTIIDPLRDVPVTPVGARERDLYRQAVVGVSMEDAGRAYIDWVLGQWNLVHRAKGNPIPMRAAKLMGGNECLGRDRVRG